MVLIGWILYFIFTFLLISYNPKLPKQIRAELERWGMRFNRNLVEVTGRVLTTEKIVFGNDTPTNQNQNCDWTNAFRSTGFFFRYGKIRAMKHEQIWVLMVALNVFFQRVDY